MRRTASLLSAMIVAGGMLALSNGTAGATTATFTSAQVGTSGSTPSFSMAGPWTMRWSFDCAANGTTGNFIVTVNQPSGDSESDLGPNQLARSGSGTDYYYDTGSFTLGVISECTWSISVASSATASTGSAASFTSSATGTTGSTSEFRVAGTWTLHWSYNCSAWGTTGNFIVTVQQLTGGSSTNSGPNELGAEGSGTETYSSPGTFNLEVLSDCTWSITVGGTEAAPPTFTTYTRIAGATADATAATELEHQFAYSTGKCPGTTGTRAVVLATDATYPDALSSAYLARSLGTGTLLTPPSALSSVTLTAIHKEGITKVYVVGGPLAVKTAVVDQLESTPADACGGADGGSGDIRVTRIWGATEYTTAEKIAETPPASDVGSLSVVGAYAGSNSSGGDGRYNDTAGLGSAAPSGTTALPTAIVATGTGFQDAEAASTLAYAEHLPILLTTPSTLSSQTSSAISALGIRQVIVMGGQLAVSNADVASLEGLGVSVLRIAGQTYPGTSVELAEFETAASSGGDGLGWTGTGSVTVARGDWFTDGLAGAVVSADGPATTAPEPLVLTLSPTSVGSALADFLHTAGTTGIGGARVTHFTVLGGTLAVTQATLNAMGGDL